MNSFPEHIRFNGQTIRVNEFINKNHSSEFEKELTGFLQRWYGPDDYIEARTSGSTGTPKIISLKKEFIAQSAMRTLHFFKLTAGDRILHCLPVKFIAGKLMVVRALIGNLDLYAVDPGTDFLFLQIEKFRFAAMVPHQVYKILDAEPRHGEWIQNLEQLLIGGSSISHSLESRMQNIAVSCYSSYAMTETATHIALRQINRDGADEYYHCLDEITVQSSANGCLQVFMPGLTEQPLKTTDLAEIKDEKTFRILGRADNVINSGGLKFSPEQVEKILEPYINQPFLFTSLPHETLGQQLVLVVEGIKTKSVVAHIQKICKKNLENYEQPRQIFFVTNIPKTLSGKPDRKMLKLI